MSQSSAPKKIIFPLDDEAIRGLRAGDPVLITGTMLTARDAAHKRPVSYTHLTLPTKA